MSTAEERLNEHREKQERARGHMALADVAQEGVTVSFLAQTFRMDGNKVKRLLATCPVKETRKRGQTQVQHIYDLATAASYLVQPKVDVEAIIDRLRPEDLPVKLQTAFWDAQRKRQTVEEHAGELWRTEKIRKVLGNTFQTIKFTLQLWGDSLERAHGLTKEQRDTLHVLVDQLQQDIYDGLKENAQISETFPESSQIENTIKRASQPFQLEPPQAEEVEPEEDWDDLI